MGYYKHYGSDNHDESYGRYDHEDHDESHEYDDHDDDHDESHEHKHRNDHDESYERNDHDDDDDHDDDESHEHEHRNDHDESHERNDHDNGSDEVIVVGGQTYTETSDDIYVSASGDTITEDHNGHDESYDATFVTEVMSASNVSQYDIEHDVMRFTTDKDIQMTGSSVDMHDFNAIIGHIVGAETLSSKGQIAADVDGNGAIDIQDAVQVLLQIWSGEEPNELALVGASDVNTAELIVIGDVDSSLEYMDIIA